jgi:YHS domain-containing protein
VRRIELPPGDDDVMPAKGGPLTKEQQELVRRWVGEGADWPAGGDAFVARELAARVLPKITFALPAIDDAQRTVIDRCVRKLREHGALVQAVAADTDALEVGLSLLRDQATDELLAGIEGLAPRLVWLDVSRTAITDASAAALAKLTELRRLQAANTKLGDATFAALGTLQHLEQVNAYGSAIGDAGLAALAKLPKLARVYAWQTKVTPAAAKAVREAAPKLQLDLGDYAGPRIDAAQREIAERTARDKPVNDTCPVADKPVDGAFTLVHEGRRIGFCCAKCRAAFEKDPAKYAAKLPPKK